MAVLGAGLFAASLLLRGLEMGGRGRGRGGDRRRGCLHLGQTPCERQREQHDGFGPQGMKLQGLFAGKIPAKGRVENGLYARRLSEDVYDRRLSIRARQKAQYLTIAKHRCRRVKCYSSGWAPKQMMRSLPTSVFASSAANDGSENAERNSPV